MDPAQADDAPSPWQRGSPSSLERSRTHRRIAGRLAMLLVAASAGVTTLTAAPVLVRLAGGGAPEAARRGVARAMWEAGYAVGPPAPEQPSTYAPKPHDYHRGSQYQGLELLEQLLAERQEEPRGNEPVPFESFEQLTAVARHDIVLLEDADPEAPPVLEVRRGQSMLVVRDTGTWLLLAVRTEQSRVRLGWVMRERVSVVR